MEVIIPRVLRLVRVDSCGVILGGAGHHAHAVLTIRLKELGVRRAILVIRQRRPR